VYDVGYWKPKISKSKVLMPSFGLSGKSADVERKLEFTAAASQGFLFGSVERC
jgi:hypothetical protein